MDNREPRNTVQVLQKQIQRMKRFFIYAATAAIVVLIFLSIAGGSRHVYTYCDIELLILSALIRARV